MNSPHKNIKPFLKNIFQGKKAHKTSGLVARCNVVKPQRNKILAKFACSLRHYNAVECTQFKSSTCRPENLQYIEEHFVHDKININPFHAKSLP